MARELAALSFLLSRSKPKSKVNLFVALDIEQGWRAERCLSLQSRGFAAGLRGRRMTRTAAGMTHTPPVVSLCAHRAPR